MLTVKKIGASASQAAAYYAEGFHKEDYYSKGQEPPGKWIGGESLGLHGGEIESQDLSMLFEGKRPGGEALVQGAGERHTPGWDMVFSAPKSVSVLWATCEADVRGAIKEAHGKAVEEALGFLKDHSLSDACRRGKGGLHREAPREIVVATFEHGTSREHDPQLHTHALLLNVARRKDGSWGALQPDGIYRDSRLVGALYRAELASRLQKSLGLEFERDGDSIRVVGVDKGVEKSFSKRRQAIEKELEEKGKVGAKAASLAALTTRARKEDRSRDRLFTDWKEEARSLGFSGKEALEVSRAERESRVSKELEKGERLSSGEKRGRDEDLALKAFEWLSERHSTFTSHKIFERIAIEGQLEAGVKELRGVFEKTQHHSHLISLEGQNQKGENLYTTREMRLLEERILKNGKEMAQRTKRVPSFESSLDRISKEGQWTLSNLSKEQIDVVRHVTKGHELSVVQGWAGAGKSTAMAASREVFEAQGARVIGVAPTGKAAENLQEGSKIPSQTIDAFLLSRGKALEGKGNGVLIVDEAAMVGSRKMDAILQIAKEKSARVVLVGDSRQLSAIDAGAPFRVLEERIGSKSLTEIRRQSILWQREAVKAFADGRALEGLQAYKEAGFVHTQETSRERDKELIASWGKATVQEKTQSLILATTNAHVESLNIQARERWKSEGLFRGKEHSLTITKRDGEREERVFQKGDRILFTKNDRDIGVTNGQFGTVERIVDRGQKCGAQVKVNLDNGKSASFNTGLYSHVEYGYASTVYKAQGSTIDRVFVAHTPGMGRESAYVALSRHKVGLDIFVSKDAFEEREWKSLVSERPVSEADKKSLMEGRIDEIIKAVAKDMEKKEEKRMSVEFEVKEERIIEVVKERPIEKRQEVKREEKVEKKKEREVSRGFSLGM